MRDADITTNHSLVLDRCQYRRWGIVSREALLRYHGVIVAPVDNMALGRHVTIGKPRVIGYRIDGMVRGSIVSVILIGGIARRGRSRSLGVGRHGVTRVWRWRTDRVVMARIRLWV